MEVTQWFRLLAASVMVCELAMRLPVIAAAVRAMVAASKGQRLLRSKRVSDHWKHRMLPRYAMMFGGNSVLFLGLLCLVLVPVVLVGLTDPAGVTGWLEGLMSVSNLIGLFVLSLGYYALRGQFGRG